MAFAKYGEWEAKVSTKRPHNENVMSSYIYAGLKSFSLVVAASRETKVPPSPRWLHATHRRWHGASDPAVCTRGACWPALRHHRRLPSLASLPPHRSKCLSPNPPHRSPRSLQTLGTCRGPCYDFGARCLGLSLSSKIATTTQILKYAKGL